MHILFLLTYWWNRTRTLYLLGSATSWHAFLTSSQALKHSICCISILLTSVVVTVTRFIFTYFLLQVALLLLWRSYSSLLTLSVHCSLLPPKFPPPLLKNIFAAEFYRSLCCQGFSPVLKKCHFIAFWLGVCVEESVLPDCYSFEAAL